MPLKLTPGNAPQKILLVTAERVGDTLFITPAIKLLKQSLPNTQFDILTFSKLAASIFINNPDVGEIHVANLQNSARKIAKNYEITINLMDEMNKKIGQMPENFYSIGKPDETVHRTVQAFEYAKSLLANPINQNDMNYVLLPKEKDFISIRKILQTLGCDLKNDILIGMQLGCHRVARRGWKIWNRNRHLHKKVWPIENYIETAKRLQSLNPNIKVILTGAESEKFMAKMVYKKVQGIINLIGKTNLFEVAALMDLLKIYLTHDTGTMHIACSRGTPLVTLFGPTPYEFTGPYPMQPQYTILKKSSVADITVDEVIEAIVMKLAMIPSINDALVKIV